jgi:DNA-binding NtrC family response regulator
MVQWLEVERSATITSLSAQRGEQPDEAVVMVPQLILALSCDQPMTAPSRHVLDDVDEVTFGRGDRACARAGRRLDLRIPDPRMSSDHGRLVRDAAGWTLDDPDSKNGSVMNGAMMRRCVLADGDLIELGHTCCLFRVAAATGGPSDLAADDVRAPFAGLETFSYALEQVFLRFARIAATDVPVLLQGATGTGKEVVARALHQLSGRHGPFVAINCGALPEALIEGELFGARRGAFSGAVADRTGLVRSANGGTLFLDEIGELRAASQTSLLRVLQEREVLPLGDTRPVPVDVRFCAASHCRLDDMVESGGFRRDLYARLHGHVVELPRLRDRREDLGLLVRALLRRLAGGDRARITPVAARLLFRHDWPNNVRELEQALAAAIAIAQDRPIGASDLPDAIRRAVAQNAAVPAAPPAITDEALRERLITLLASHAGNVAAVARELGKERIQIHRWARRLGIDLDAYRR